MFQSMNCLHSPQTLCFCHTGLQRFDLSHVLLLHKVFSLPGTTFFLPYSFYPASSHLYYFIPHLINFYVFQCPVQMSPSLEKLSQISSAPSPLPPSPFHFLTTPFCPCSNLGQFLCLSIILCCHGLIIPVIPSRFRIS